MPQKMFQHRVSQKAFCNSYPFCVFYRPTTNSQWRSSVGLQLLVAVITKYTDGPAWIRFTCLAISFIVAGYYTAIDTFQVLKRFKLDIDVLMFAAAFGAAAIGHYEEGAFLLVLFALGGAG